MSHPLSNPSPTLRTLSLTLCALFATLAIARADEIKLPPRTSPVYDGAGVLSDESQAHLRARCDEILNGAHASIGVVTVASLNDVPIEDYAVKLYSAWGLGVKGADRGVLVLVAPTDHKLRIEVGYGLEGILPDGKVGRIRDEFMVPAFKANDYDAGIVGAVDAIAKVIADDAHITLADAPAPAAPQRVRHRGAGGGSMSNCCIILLVVGFIIISNMFRMFRPRIFPWLGGGWGGGGWGGWSGGSGGFGGGGGGGGGDWGGFGGGSSGGGGASGSW